MAQVKNTSKGARSLWARQTDGNLALEWLEPGETRNLDVDAADPIFTGGDFRVVEPAAKAAAPKPSKAKAKAASKSPAPATAPETQNPDTGA